MSNERILPATHRLLNRLAKADMSLFPGPKNSHVDSASITAPASPATTTDNKDEEVSELSSVWNNFSRTNIHEDLFGNGNAQEKSANLRPGSDAHQANKRNNNYWKNNSY